MLELRKVNVEDWDFILKIRNEEKYRMYFYEQKKISKEEHYEYLKKMSTNSNFFNWIICYDSKDVGYIRILNEDISIMMDLEFNGKGLGTKALKLVENKARENGIKKLVGKVSPNFCDQTIKTNEAIAEGTPYEIKTEILGEASCKQTIRRRL